MRSIAARLAFAVLWLGCISAPAMTASAPCGGDFNAWLEGFEQEAAAQGVSERTIQSALAGVTYDPGIIARDHAQGVFRQSFEQFSGRMVPPRLSRGAKLLAQYGPVFGRIEQQYGVPGAVIVAIWGLETDFGADPANSRPSARWPHWPTTVAARTNFAASCWRRCASSNAATWRQAKCAAPGRARSARLSSCRRPT